MQQNVYPFGIEVSLGAPSMIIDFLLSESL